LPDGLGGDGAAGWVTLLTGSHTLRVWSAGPTMARVALLGTLGESDIIRDGADLWTWSSDNNTVTHVRLPAAANASTPHTLPSPLPSALASIVPTSPAQAAIQLLSRLDKTTSVRSNGTVSVAGRSADELVIAPRDSRSLVSSIRIDVDSVESVPLRVRVFARGYGKPALDIGFTEVSFDRPDPALFHFKAPPGAKVTQVPDRSDPSSRSEAPAPGGTPSGTHPQATIIGSGWTAIVAARVPVAVPPVGSAPPSGGQITRIPRGGSVAGPLAAIVNELPRVSGTWGSGRMMSTRLLSVLITDDGRVYAGAVSPSAVMAAAGSPQGQLPSPAPTASHK
jgi:outer membrane lipoprotein-sorting protein